MPTNRETPPKMPHRRTVLIPLVERKPDGSGCLLQLYIDLDVKLDSAGTAQYPGIDPIINKLLDINLQGSGGHALAQTRKLLDARAKRFFDLDRRQIHYGSQPIVTEDHSAELGIALLLLMAGAGSQQKSIIATGKLGESGNNAPVEPVQGLRIKLATILEEVKSGNLHGATTVFIPESAKNQQEQEQEQKQKQERAEIDKLCIALRAKGLTVIPVPTLKDAAAHLDINLDVRRRLIVRRAVLSGVALLCAGAVGIAVWSARQPIPLRLESPTGGAGSLLIRCFSPRKGLPDYESLPRDGLTPQVPVNGNLSWLIRLGEPPLPNPSLSNRLLDKIAGIVGYEGYHLAVAYVGERSGLHFLATENGAAQLRKRAGTIWGRSQQLDDQAEAGVLVFLVKRFFGFDLDALQKQFEERFTGSTRGANASGYLSLAADFLAKQADGSLAAYFQSVHKPSPCDETSRPPRPP
ncbi:MAG: hypothetical protein P9F19_08415 [Candidatus Contendobacter sp.]|nr:hypothetical protein [Candidatus Contendobacter sp.]MDG4557395.1 hypothetical protein [Candidatus Contendobacter sp.]